MKTNQVLKRDENFVQRTKDGYFNATTLIASWNERGGEIKVLGNYQLIKGTKDFIEQLKSEGIENPMITGRGSGKNAGTWMHPKLFIDLAMWVSLEFKSKVIDYVLDGLIVSRNEAGDYYKEMCATIMDSYVDYYKRKPPISVYAKEALLVKSFVPAKDRNEMTEDELKQLTYLQKVNSNLISKNMGKATRIKWLKVAAEVKI